VDNRAGFGCKSEVYQMMSRSPPPQTLCPESRSTELPFPSPSPDQAGGCLRVHASHLPIRDRFSARAISREIKVHLREKRGVTRESVPEGAQEVKQFQLKLRNWPLRVNYISEYYIGKKSILYHHYGSDRHHVSDATLDKRLKYISETITRWGSISRRSSAPGDSDQFVKRFLERMAPKLPNPISILERLKRVARPRE